MTIKEFAAQLNLSTATVSRAFTPGARIRPDTRTHILEQARLLGYAPNPHARNLTQRRNRLIGMDYPGNPDMLSDLYLVELARGVQSAAQAADYGLLFNTLPRPGGDLELLREWVFGRAVDGVVIVVSPRFPVETLATLAGRDVPCVVITPGPLPTPVQLPTLLLDLAEGARAAMTHLRRLGHERIGFILDSNDAVESLYTELLKSDKLYDPRLLVETASTIAEGRAAMHRLLAAPQRPSAVFCRTDVLALGALRAIRDMGLRVPEDISLIGHDDIVLVELSDPALTTTRIDTARIGQLAVQMLLDAQARVKHRHAAEPPASGLPPVVTVGTELIVRDSTGPVTAVVTHHHSPFIPKRVPM